MTRKGLKVAVLLASASVVAMVAPGLAEAAVVKEFTGGVSSPGAMASGSDGNVWFINGAGIAKIDSAGQVTTYTAGLNPGATPYDLTSGPNGDVWFTDNGAKAVGFVTPGGAIHEFSAPAGDVPLQIVAGSDGNIWFYSVDGATHSIVKMTPGGTFTGYPFMSSLSEIADNMVLGPDGDIWFSDMGTTSIGKIAPNGTITEYPLGMGAIPTNITVGPDGNLWFSDNSGAIGRITTGGSVHEFTSGLQTGAVPDAIAPGPDGNVWFTDQYGNQRAIGRVTPSGQITEFTAGLNDDLPLDITAGADGNLWVPQASMDPMTPSAVAEITPSGQITEITNGVNPTGLEDGDSILAGPNGALWFTDSRSPDAIGRIVISPIAITGPATAVSSTGATITGSVTPFADTSAVSIQYGTSPSLGFATAADGSLRSERDQRAGDRDAHGPVREHDHLLPRSRDELRRRVRRRDRVVQDLAASRTAGPHDYRDARESTDHVDDAVDLGLHREPQQARRDAELGHDQELEQGEAEVLERGLLHRQGRQAHDQEDRPQARQASQGDGHGLQGQREREEAASFTEAQAVRAAVRKAHPQGDTLVHRDRHQGWAKGQADSEQDVDGHVQSLLTAGKVARAREGGPSVQIERIAPPSTGTIAPVM